MHLNNERPERPKRTFVNDAPLPKSPEEIRAEREANASFLLKAEHPHYPWNAAIAEEFRKKMEAERIPWNVANLRCVFLELQDERRIPKEVVPQLMPSEADRLLAEKTQKDAARQATIQEELNELAAIKHIVRNGDSKAFKSVASRYTELTRKYPTGQASDVAEESTPAQEDAAEITELRSYMKMTAGETRERSQRDKNFMTRFVELGNKYPTIYRKSKVRF